MHSEELICTAFLSFLFPKMNFNPGVDEASVLYRDQERPSEFIRDDLETLLCLQTTNHCPLREFAEQIVRPLRDLPIPIRAIMRDPLQSHLRQHEHDIKSFLCRPSESYHGRATTATPAISLVLGKHGATPGARGRKGAVEGGTPPGSGLFEDINHLYIASDGDLCGRYAQRDRLIHEERDPGCHAGISGRAAFALGFDFCAGRPPGTQGSHCSCSVRALRDPL